MYIYKDLFHRDRQGNQANGLKNKTLARVGEELRGIGLRH